MATAQQHQKKEEKTVDFHSKIDATKDENGTKHVDAKFSVKTEPTSDARFRDDFNRKLDLGNTDSNRDRKHHEKRFDDKGKGLTDMQRISECGECNPNSINAGGKTPKDLTLRLDAHTDEAGKKEIDMKFHFEGKRDHLDDGKDKEKDGEQKDHSNKDTMIDIVQTAAMAMSENTSQGPSGMVGAAVSAVGAQLTGNGRTPEEMEEFREKGGIVGAVKRQIGEKMYEKGENLKTRHNGEVVRTVPDAIKYHYAHAEHYHREGLIQEELSKKEVLTRGDRKAAKKKAREYFEMEKVELSRAHAQERLLTAPIKVEYLEPDHKKASAAH